PTILDPDGVTVRTASIVSNRFLFTGREYNALFGFYEYRARAYHPGLGRFMSEDPKLFDAGDYNLFRYCHNDPIDFTDPMGTLEQYHDLLAQAREAAQQVLRQIAHAEALAKALSWHPGGAIATGLANA